MPWKRFGRAIGFAPPGPGEGPFAGASEPAIIVGGTGHERLGDSQRDGSLIGLLLSECEIRLHDQPLARGLDHINVLAAPQSPVAPGSFVIAVGMGAFQRARSIRRTRS